LASGSNDQRNIQDIENKVKYEFFMRENPAPTGEQAPGSERTDHHVIS
jgi:hypothetical protein